MKKALSLLILSLPLLSAGAADYYISPTGDDSAAGTKDAPFRTIAAAQAKIKPGDTVYLRGGTYRPTVEESMGTMASIYSCAYIFDKSGTPEKPITYMAYPGENPVFDMSGYAPEGMRVSAFYVSGSWLRFKGLEVTGTRVMISNGSNTQSECFSNRGGSHNVYENLKMHDGMAIGWYLVKGGDNLVLNCDAWNNCDPSNGGGNVDGFGCHPFPGGTGNVLRGCRSWWNSDDGFDLINSSEPVTIDSCWAFYNGYLPDSFDSAADGNGIKAGGYGMKKKTRKMKSVPVHEVKNCLAYRNKNSGIYSNHHLGGIVWLNNTSASNRWNYNMVNRKSVEEAVDIAGYGHYLANNVSFSPGSKDIINVDVKNSTMVNNTFGPTVMTLSDNDFESVDPSLLVAPRKADGSLPDIPFLRPVPASKVAADKMGYTFPAPAYPIR